MYTNQPKKMEYIKENSFENCGISENFYKILPANLKNSSEA